MIEKVDESWSTGKSGHWKEYNKSAILIAEGLYVNGRKHGVWKEYYDTGQLMIVESYSNGIKHGNFRAYYPSGQQASEGQFKYGWRQGYFTVYDEDGAPKKPLLFVNDVQVDTITDPKKHELSQKHRN
jgi:antitoxin component YwqK of YwqJK toxin-antitoxin module